MQVSDGMNYAPKGKPSPVVKSGQFVFSAIGLDHGHIGGMCNGLTEAGGTLKWIYDPDPAKVARYLEMYPGAKAARCEAEAMEDPAVHMVACACITSERCDMGLRAMRAGKDFFVDKAPMTTLAQVEAARRVAAETGRIYAVYYGERLHNEEAIFAGQLIQQGAIGRVIQTIGLGPHRLNPPSRPKWFFEREKYGGILCDIGSHQIEQFLYFTGSHDASITYARALNQAHPDYPELQDFGECTLVGDTGASGYIRVDWFTPDGLPTWGDGRTMILGTEGYIELRKYIDLGHEGGGVVHLVNGEKHHQFNVVGKVGFPYFGQLILDSLNRTENAMSQAHTFKAAELCIRAQMLAEMK